MAKKVLKVVGCAVAAVILIVAAYVAYVMLSYNRIEDNLALEPEAALTASTTTEADTRAAISAGEDFTIITANLGFGAYSQDFSFFMDGGTESRAASADAVRQNINGECAALLELDPTFVMLQEVDTDGTRSHHVNELDLVKQDFATYGSVFAQNYHSAYLAWPLTEPHGKNNSGIVTFAKTGVDSATRRSLPISNSLSKFLDLDRCYSISRVALENGHDLVLFNVHLSAYGADESIMTAQRELLYSDMCAEVALGNYVIAGGDFNHDMIGNSPEVFGNSTSEVESWAKPFDFDGVPDGLTVAIKEAYDQAISEDSEGSTFTQAATCRDTSRAYDGTNDRWIMDTFIYSDNLECVQINTVDLDFQYSDHNPVQATFRLAATN